MIKEVLFQIQHLKFVNLDSGKYCLIVEDTEVNDYVEEYMLDKGIEIEDVDVNDNDKISIYYNYFSENSNLEKIIETLKKIDSKEVVTIFSLNN
ncbi:hypothetical protein C3L50_09970 [Flavobacterium alvei]|uniref:DUF4265 domain-containing protein n=1 Tax=Flavobacterium alvei TaxID=2080416 RepID=A0A2S5AAB1_9FLAO|nr:hypothetical protein [Flavobacterium alvei]POY39495.1 hypothetical protein C3L50_09970 [Flavobacterium alvei]